MARRLEDRSDAINELPSSFASSATVRRRMQRQRERDTVPELALRRALFARGYRYRVNYRPVPSLRRSADIVFVRQQIAVFVDGCFWHGCPEHGRRQHRINDWYWPKKIEGNCRRDIDTNRRLEAACWTVLRFWEHTPILEAVTVIVEKVKAASQT